MELYLWNAHSSKEASFQKNGDKTITLLILIRYVYEEK